MKEIDSIFEKNVYAEFNEKLPKLVRTVTKIIISHKSTVIHNLMLEYDEELLEENEENLGMIHFFHIQAHLISFFFRSTNNSDAKSSSSFGAW